MLELVISGRTLSHPPTAGDLSEAVQAVLAGREEFVILENGILGVTLQLAGTADAPLLEHIEDPPGLPIAAVPETVTPTEIKRAFTYLLHNDPRWRQTVRWSEFGTHEAELQEHTISLAEIAVVMGVALVLVLLALVLR